MNVLKTMAVASVALLIGMPGAMAQQAHPMDFLSRAPVWVTAPISVDLQAQMRIAQNWLKLPAPRDAAGTPI